MTEPGFLLLKSRILQMLATGLDPRLTYHNRGHTEDVLQHAERIALAEKISDARLILLIKIAALFHDTGFLITYKGHEQRSCEIMLDILDTREFDEAEIKKIVGMIMATKMPQSPVIMQEKILCDADLDYLGRNDFDVINNRLRNELLAYGIIEFENDWDQFQVSFLEKHNYFTSASIKERAPLKAKHLAMLKKNLSIRGPNYI